MIKKIFLSLVIITACCGIGFTSYAEEQSINPTLEKGIGQYKHENYEEALTLLEKAKQEEPESTLAAYYLGLTYKQLQDYKKAVTHLTDAVTYAPKIKGALIELIDCLYQVGELDKAKTWIAEAEKEGIRPAQVAFLKGLVLLKDEDPEGAIAAFENAKELDKTTEQACDYQIGIAHLKAMDFKGAKEAFKEVIISNPSSNIANYANEYIDALSKREEIMRPWKFSFGTAWQYDTNVVLKPDDASVATNIAEEEDSREVFTADIEHNKRFEDRWGIKLQNLFYYAKQNDLSFYDTLANTLVVQPSIYFKKSLLTFPATYSYTMVDDRSYLSSPSLSGIYNLMINASNMAQAYIKYSYKDYRWAPSTPDEDRDSNDFGGGLGWYFFFTNNKGFLNLRYALNREWTEGNNWDYTGNRVSAAVLIPLLEKLNFTLSGDAYFQDFLNSHTVYNTDRRDRLYSASALIAYKFYKDSELQLQYTFVKDDSNISVYTYDRNIYSVGAVFKF